MAEILTVPAPPGCFFNPEDHTYWHGLNKLLGVSEILRGAALVDEIGFSEEARQRGSDVHLLTQWLEDGELDWKNAEANGLAGYLHCYENWLRMSGFKILLREQVLFDITLGAGGTLDRAGFMPAPPRGHVPAWNVPTILDIKTGVERPEHELQLAGYDVLLPESYLPKPRRLACLYLDRDGGEAGFVAFKDYRARYVFKGALTVTQWKANR